MKPLTKGLILLVVVVFYSLIYLASRPPQRCDDNCQMLYRLDTTLINRFNYVYGSSRCTYRQNSDTLCIYVRDTTGINWDRLADTVCSFANSVGLYQQKIFLIRQRISSPADTVARKVCP